VTGDGRSVASLKMFGASPPPSPTSDRGVHAVSRALFTCYVNRPLIRFDRSPAEVRHVGVSSEWNNFEFWLRNNQLRLEGLLRLSDGLPEKIRMVIRERLSSVHSGWTNWYLETGQYKRAREAVSRAARLDLSFNLAAKWLLMWTSPQLALRTVQRRQKRGKDSFTV